MSENVFKQDLLQLFSTGQLLLNISYCDIFVTRFKVYWFIQYSRSFYILVEKESLHRNGMAAIPKTSFFVCCFIPSPIFFRWKVGVGKPQVNVLCL